MGLLAYSIESTRSLWYSDIFFWQVTITFQKTWKKNMEFPVKAQQNTHENPIFDSHESNLQANMLAHQNPKPSPQEHDQRAMGAFLNYTERISLDAEDVAATGSGVGRISSWHFSGINHGIFVTYILVGGLEPWNIMEFYDFPFSWECHHPNWRSPSFFRGVGSTTNQYR